MNTMTKPFYILIMCIIHIVASPSFGQPVKDLIQCNGDKLVLGSEQNEILFRGFCYSGFSFYSPGIPNRVDEKMYSELKELNLNTVRISLSYDLFYDLASPKVYIPEIWNWINSHIDLARKYDAYLILQLTRIEGAQFTPIPNMPFDYRIWQDENIQDNFISLWAEIAGRYQHETRIAGYNIFCEPVCSGPVSQWSDLAIKTINEIREVDKYHIIFVERAYGENEVRREFMRDEIPPADAFFKINDRNVVYELYFFETDDYTHQFAPWRLELQNNEKYPDPESVITYQEKGGETNKFLFDKDFLEFYLKKQIEFGQLNKVPMSVWGFGLTSNCYKEGNGGLQWMKDVLGLFDKHNLSWTVFYNSPFFGINNNPEVKRLLQNTVRSKPKSLQGVQ